MDFNVNVKLDVAPALTEAISELAKAIGKGASTGITRTAITDGNMKFVPTQTPVAAPTKERPSLVQMPAEETGGPSAKGKITMEMIRALTAQKADKHVKMKAVLKDMGFNKVPDLTEDKYAEFYNRIAAL